MKTVRWTARILSLCILVFSLPFYFGYGNPLPFTKPEYTLWENIALTMVPLVFVGLAVGWKWPKIGGFLVVIPIIIGFIVGLFTKASFSGNLLVPLVPGVLYLVDGLRSKEAETTGTMPKDSGPQQ